ncbi:MAG: CPBP family intramembrane metalloprotease [Clostridia bacterium]|nr:CPBP family intramembrane metalloprotease [Clostridia bacterium]
MFSDASKRASFLLLTVFVLLLVSDFLAPSGTDAFSLCLLQLAFLLAPALFYGHVVRLERQKSRLCGFSFRFLPFILSFTVAVTLGIGLINYGLAFLFPKTSGMDTAVEYTLPELVLVIVLLPAVCEEILMRGMIFSEYETYGTAAACVASAVAFAFIHASASNFIGPLVAGMAYAYLTYACRSVFPAVLAHGVNNLFSVYAPQIYRLLLNEDGAGYVLALMVIAFLAALYLTLRQGEALYRAGHIAPFKKGKNAVQILLSPWLAATVAVWVIRIFTVQ